MSHQPGRHFLQIPGPTNTPLPVLAAIAKPTIDHRGPEFGKLGREVLAGIRTIFKTEQPGRHLPGLRHGRLGGGARQHALARRPGADVRDRLVRDALEQDGDAARPRGRVHHGRLALRRRTRTRSRRGSPRTRRARSRPSRVVHNETSTGVASGIAAVRRAHRQGRPSGAPPRRHDLLARLDRLPPRRVGRRRHRRRLAEGADAAAGPVLQRGLRQGARGREDGASCRAPSGTGRR